MSGALGVAAGATIVEKHLTYDCTATGPDHSASADPEAFAQYVKLIRRAEVLRGGAGKTRARHRARRAHRQPSKPRALSRREERRDGAK
jgi:sialic acid synthase SpsE